MQIAECNAPVAKNIAGVIENKGLKQVYIAEKAGYSPQELNDMLNGRRLIKANDMEFILTWRLRYYRTLPDIYRGGSSQLILIGG